MYLTIPWKQEYVLGKKYDGCIFCDIMAGKLESFTIYENEEILIVLNIYPYNPGHVLVVPKRHVELITELSDEEFAKAFSYAKKALQLIDSVYHPHGFNIGLNQGVASGASIRHVHIHVVPRYEHEMGFMETASGTRIQLDPLEVACEKLKAKADIFDSP